MNDLQLLHHRLRVGTVITCRENTYRRSQRGAIRRVIQLGKTSCKCTVDGRDGTFDLSLPRKAREVTWLGPDLVQWPLQARPGQTWLHGHTVMYLLPRWTEPGTLDLSERLPESERDEVAAARAACDAVGHPPNCFNPLSATTYCRCGVVQYPGDCAPPPDPNQNRPTSAGKPVTDPHWNRS
jgi:hypothetical protein